MRNAIHVVSAIDSNTQQEQEGHQTSAVTTAASQQYHNCRTTVAVHHSCRTATATSAAPAVQRKARAVFQTHSTKSN